MRVIALAENRGGAARNVGVAATTTPYVAFSDDDSWWAPGALARAADLLDAHPRLGVVNGHILVGPGERDDPTCLAMARSPLPAEPGDPGPALLGFIACAAIVRRTAFEEAGGFLARALVGGEEEILGWDLAARGWRMSYVPEVVAHHHPSPARDPHERRARGVRNLLWTTWLRRPVGPALRRTLRLLATLPRDRVSLRGLLAALAGTPWVVRHRRPSPPHVERMRRLLDEQEPRAVARRAPS